MKKIVIIGASSGIGLQTAADFAAMGWRVGMAARRTEPMKALKEAYPQNIEYAALDVEAEDAPRRLGDLIEAIDGMDVLLFASGVGFSDPELNDAKLTNTLQVNVVGFARILAYAYKYFRDTANVSAGQIAAITSVAGTKGLGVAAGYSASKRFQQQFIDALDQLAHIQHVNVKFTDIRPGFVRTALLRDDRDYPMIMSVEEAALCVRHAILKQKRVSTVDSRWRIVNALWRMIPRCVWTHLNVDLNTQKPN